MTYCIGMLVDTGLVFLSDSRTNAGVDHVATFRKLTVFGKPRERAIITMTAGNLALSQGLVSRLQERARDPEIESLMTVANMNDAARCVGRTLRELHALDSDALKDHGIEFNVSVIVGGQIGTEPPRLFNVYAAGNFIEATADTPYFQIGESKYGKPIIDRVITRSSSIAEATKCALISMDSTIRSNLSVGPPFDLACIRRDTCEVQFHRSIAGDDEYFGMIRKRWGEALRHAFHELPNPHWPD